MRSSMRSPVVDREPLPCFPLCPVTLTAKLPEKLVVESPPSPIRNCWQKLFEIAHFFALKIAFLSNLEEGYLKQKLKLHWLEVGDKNNSYFHNSVKVRSMRNSIREVTTSTSEVLKDTEEIKKEATSSSKHFSTISLRITKVWAAKNSRHCSHSAAPRVIALLLRETSRMRRFVESYLLCQMISLRVLMVLRVNSSRLLEQRLATTSWLPLNHSL